MGRRKIRQTRMFTGRKKWPFHVFTRVTDPVGSETTAPSRYKREAGGIGDQIVLVARVAVSDNGIGIGSEYAERIFLIFQRLHTRDTAHSPGTRFVFTFPGPTTVRPPQTVECGPW